MNLLEEFQDALRRLRVEIPQRLVGQEQRGGMHKRPRNSDPLQLASRELMRKSSREAREAKTFQEFERGAAGMRLPRQQQGQLDILDRAERGKQVKKLEYEPDLRTPDGGQLLIVQATRGCSVNPDFPARWQVHRAGKI